MHFHFIAIGGSIMHNLAICMKKLGHIVSGSDDEIFEPAAGRLRSYGLFPEYGGWNPAIIDEKVDAVILGMHARADNPELLRAKEAGVRIYSFPEYMYEQSLEKTRVVVGGSHGKTTITSMIMHVLRQQNASFDYLVGAQLEGFETMVQISDAPVIIMEGDEYLTSALDPKPKFHWYRPQIALLSGIAWDHINVFPDFDLYVRQFEIFIQGMERDAVLVYYCDDEVLNDLVKKYAAHVQCIPYAALPYETSDGVCSIRYEGETYPMNIFGRHNMANLAGAMEVCNRLGVGQKEFLSAMQSFKGAAKRLETVAVAPGFHFYRDFAHSPSKLSATITAVKEQYPQRELTACMELHTFSSLNSVFIDQYKGCMDRADTAWLFYSPHAVEMKKLTPISEEEMKTAFGRSDLQIISNATELMEKIGAVKWNNSCLLMMSSGDFDGFDFKKTAEEIISRLNT